MDSSDTYRALPSDEQSPPRARALPDTESRAARGCFFGLLFTGAGVLMVYGLVSFASDVLAIWELWR